jgi:fermentation-respiration switch protein FrsA (DUF1100 family)
MGLALEPHFIKRLFGIFICIFAIYVVFLAALVVGQRNLMYFPDAADFDPAKVGLPGFTRLTYRTADGVDIHGFYAPPIQPHRLTLIFFQGNAGSLGWRAEKIKHWRRYGFGVMLATYRGYAGNKGTPTEAGLYYDARAAIAALKPFGVTRNNMIFYGESLGTGIATQMAAEDPPAGVILETPYTSLPDVGTIRYPLVPIFWIMQDKYMSIDKIAHIKSPLLVIQAGKDHVIPPILAQRLFNAANPPKNFITNPSADHNTVYASPLIIEQIVGFLQKVEEGKLAYH